MMAFLNLEHLECEEAMSLIRMSIRKNGLPITVSSDSQSFKILLSKWADSGDRTLIESTESGSDVWTAVIAG